MPGAFKICDNHAVKCKTVYTEKPAGMYRGREVRFCGECIDALVRKERLWIDEKIDAEEQLGPIGAAESINYKRRRVAFDEWLERNSDVWTSFVQVADEMRSRLDHCSHWMVANVVRYERIKRQKQGDFKIPNDAIAFMARKYMGDTDRRARRGFFKIKRIEGEDWKDTKARCGIGRQNS